MSDRAIAKLSTAAKMLAAIRTPSDAKKVINLAEAARVYAKKVGLGLQAQNQAAEIKVRAERRAGELLVEMGEKRGRPKKGHRVPLSELGIARIQSKRWQRIARLRSDAFEDYITRTLEEGDELTESDLLRLFQSKRAEARRQRNRALIEGVESLNAIRQTFPTIVVDPPWDWGDEGDENQLGRARPEYATKSIAEIQAEPVAEMAQENAHLYVWITNRSLPKGFDLLKAWGFRYVTALTWVKPSIGMGNYFRGSSEHVLFGVRGSLPLLRNNVGTWFAAPRPGGHSAKPDEFYELVETCSPGPWLDVYGRRARSGWIVWGEAGVLSA